LKSFKKKFLDAKFSSPNFQSPAQIITNLVSALEKRRQLTQQEKNKNLVATDPARHQELIIWLVGIDQLLLSPADTALLNLFISQLFKPDTAFTFNLKLVLTTSAPLSTPLVNVTVKSHEPISPPISLETSLGQLYQLFKHLGLAVATELLNRLVEILKETRYGLRESEICDLLGHSKHNNDSVLVWLLFKFYPRLAESANSLARSLVDNDQVLHRLFAPCKFKISKKLSQKTSIK